MSKIIKHEFRAMGRMILPVLGLFALAALFDAVLERISGAAGALKTLTTIVLACLFIAIGVISLIAIIGRFYRNTMTDDAYLTMTLPVSTHGFIWGELFTALFWAMIIAAVLAVVSAVSLQVAGLIDLTAPIGDLLEAMGSLNDVMARHNISWVGIMGAGLQVLLAAALAFAAYVLHIYCSMAIGQLFNKNREVLSILAYFVIRVFLVALCVLVIGFAVRCGYTGFPTENVKGMAAVNAALGCVNGALLLLAGILYVPVWLLLDKKLNLI